MSCIHSHHFGYHRCTWTHESNGICLDCTDEAAPGSVYCVDCGIRVLDALWAAVQAAEKEAGI